VPHAGGPPEHIVYRGRVKIALMDSGIGLLAATAAVRRLRPDADLVLSLDPDGMPWGPRTSEDLTRRALAVAEAAAAQGPQALIVGCNTASVHALPTLRARLEPALPVVGTVPAIKPAAEMSKTRVIGVLGTEATVRQPYVDNLAAEFAPDCLIVRHGSPALVDLAEAKLAGADVTVEAVKEAAQPLFDAPNGERIDVGVLACTHFPLLRRELLAGFPGIEWIDGGPGIARRIAYLTREQAWPPHAGQGVMVFTAEPRSPLLGTLAHYGIGEVRTL
jgi:glutamate racemase